MKPEAKRDLTGAGWAILSLLNQFEGNERLDADEVLRRQFARLRRLLAHASRTVPFYKGRFPGRDKGLVDVTPDDWFDLPRLTRGEVQEAGSALHSRRVPKEHGRVAHVMTSGTTGRPIKVLRTQRTALYWSAFTVRDHLWHGRDFSGKLAVMRRAEKGIDAYPDGTVAKLWGPTNHIFDTGPAIALNLNSSVAEMVEWLQRHNPEYLLTHPTNLYRIASYSRENGIKLSNLRQAMTVSEVLRPEVRSACNDAWGVGVTDIYTGRDVGYMALQCPDTEDYHVQAEGVYLEVLDEEGRPCKPGEVGRVVVTPLHNYAMPLIRYEIGDYAEVGAPCACGRSLPVIRRIVGREQDMVVLPNGEKRWTLLSTGNIEALLELAPIRQYQFIQRNLTVIEARLVVERELTKQEKQAIREWLIAKLDHPFTIEFSFVGRISRTPAGKYQDFISEIGKTPAVPVPEAQAV